MILIFFINFIYIYSNLCHLLFLQSYQDSSTVEHRVPINSLIIKSVGFRNISKKNIHRSKFHPNQTKPLVSHFHSINIFIY